MFQGKQQFCSVLLLIKCLCGLELFIVSCWEGSFNFNRKRSTNPREWVPIVKVNLNLKKSGPNSDTHQILRQMENLYPLEYEYWSDSFRKLAELGCKSTSVSLTPALPGYTALLFAVYMHKEFDLVCLKKLNSTWRFWHILILEQWRVLLPNEFP